MNKDQGPLQLIDRKVAAQEASKAPGANPEQEAHAEIAEMRNAISSQAQELTSTLAQDAEGADEEIWSELQGFQREVAATEQTFEAESRPGKMEARNWRDAEGKDIGDVGFELAEVDPKDVEGMGLKAKEMRELRSLKIKGEKGEIDVLEMANRHGVRLYVPQDPTVRAKWMHQWDKGRILAPLPESPVHMAILLHELGHADQSREERFKGPRANYAHALEKKKSDKTYIEPRDVDIAVGAVPEADRGTTKENVAKWEELKAVLQQAVEARDEVAYERDRADAKAEEAWKQEWANNLPFDRAAMKDRIDDTLLLDEGAEKEAVMAKLLQDLGVDIGEPTEELEANAPKAEPVELDIFGDSKISVDPVALSKADVPDGTMVNEVLYKLSNLTSDGAKEISADGELRIELPDTADGKRVYARVMLPGAGEQMRKADVAAAPLRSEVDALQARVTEAAKVVEVADKARLDHVAKAQIREIIAMPARVMERDANRRALMWLRQIREKSGADVLASVRMPANMVPYKSGDEEGCESSVKQDLQDASQEEVVLSSWDATQHSNKAHGSTPEKMRLKKHPDDIGVIPQPGLSRTGHRSLKYG